MLSVRSGRSIVSAPKYKDARGCSIQSFWRCQRPLQPENSRTITAISCSKRSPARKKTQDREAFMARQVEFFFDYGSPFSYLADTQLAALAQRTGATVVYRPMLLGAVLKETGNASPMTVPAKGRYMGVELRRWAKHYGVPFAANKFFPINTLRLMRGAVAAQQAGCFAGYHRAIYPAFWVDGV